MAMAMAIVIVIVIGRDIILAIGDTDRESAVLTMRLQTRIARRRRIIDREDTAATSWTPTSSAGQKNMQVKDDNEDVLGVLEQATCNS